MSSKKNLTGVGIVAIILLLLLNAYLIWNKYNQDALIASQSKENSELVIAKTEVEKNFYEAMSELETLRTGNDSLNVLIDQQQDDLANERRRLLKISNNEKELTSAIKDMRSQNDGFIARINKLMSENADLNFALDKSEKQKSDIKLKYNSELSRGNELEKQVSDLEVKKGQLERNENQLAKKVNAASVIQVDRVSVSGLKTKSSGKKVVRSRASNVDILEVCFNTTKNYAAGNGEELFYIVMMNPLGQTIGIESMGAGAIKDIVTGKQMKFTRVRKVEYKQGSQEVCLEWTPSNGVSSGRYETLIYNKGYLSGKGSVEFK